MNYFHLKDKKAIVTGAGRGIGAAIAYGLAEAGAEVLLVSRTLEELEKQAERIRQNDHNAIVHIKTCDVSEAKDVEALLAYVDQLWDAPDILVNNAGINVKGPFLECDLETWQKILNVNLTGEFLMAQGVARRMAKKGSGSIINMASVGGFMALPLTAPYCASKGGILQMTRVMAHELAPQGVRVNALCPGYIDTGLLKDPVVKEKVMASFIARTPMGRAGKPEDLVGGAIFLASEASAYVTGIVLPIDGGMSCSVS